MIDIADNLQEIRRRIENAVTHAGRAASQSITLVAVSKGHSEDAVKAAHAAGQTVFGENRVQEAKAKFGGLRMCDPSLELHLIGPLQTNKADDAVRLFDVIQTLDRPKLASALASAIQKTGCRPKFYIEVNSGGEAQKSGITSDHLVDFLRLCRQEYGLTITGLMCIPPQHEDPAPHFEKIRRLAEKNHLNQISMGMSADYEIAIRHGATHVRIGTAIFGPR